MLKLGCSILSQDATQAALHPRPPAVGRGRSQTPLHLVAKRFRAERGERRVGGEGEGAGEVGWGGGEGNQIYPKWSHL